MKRTGLFLLIAALWLVACGAQATPEPTKPPATTPPQQATGAPTTGAVQVPTQAAPSAALPYRIGMVSDIKTTNYWSYQGPNNSVYQSYVMTPQRLSLYDLDDKRFDLIPQVATDLNAPRVQEGDKWTITVHVKPDVKWSDGKPLTAKDVAFTANTAIQLELTGPMATIYDREFLDSVTAVDDTTVKFIWKKAPGIARWEYGAAQGHILSEAFWAPVVADAKKSLAGVDKTNKDAYAKALKDAQQTLYNYAPVNEPLIGGFNFVKWEKGAFVENSANASFWFKGLQVAVYKNGAYAESKGAYSYKQGDASGDKLVEYVTGPYATGAIYTIYGTQDAVLLALKKGDIDYWEHSLGLPRGLMDQVQGQKGINLATNPTNGFRYMAFNVRKAPMSDVNFRQALAYIVDKEFITKNILQGVAFPVYTEVPSANAFWYNPDVPKFGQGMSTEERLNKAISLLQGAGYKWEGDKKPTWDKTAVRVVPGGRLIMPNGQPVPNLTLIAPSAGYDPLRSTFAIWIERYANDMGIPLRAELIGFNDLITRVYDDPDYATKLDMYILGWSLTIFPDYLRDFHHSSLAGPGDNNAGGYSNPEFDKLSDQLLTCATFEACKPIAFQLQTMLATDLPYITLFDTGIVEPYRDTLNYPYTDTLSGIQFRQGLTTKVKFSAMQ